MLRLYDSLISGNAYKVRLLLALLGRDFERIEMPFDETGTRSEEFKQKNPAARIPLLELEDGTILAESNAIQFYLAEGTPYLPQDRFERAQVLQWMFFEQYSHEPCIAVVRHWIHLGLGDEKAAEIAEKRAGGEAALAIMEGELAEGDWLVGNHLTIADIALYAYTHVASEGGFDLDPYPSIRDWIARIETVPGYVPISHG